MEDPLDPAAIMAEHAGHGSRCQDFYIAAHCQPYLAVKAENLEANLNLATGSLNRLAAENAALRKAGLDCAREVGNQAAHIQRLEDLRDELRSERDALREQMRPGEAK